jgi:hypothetical protein
MNPDVSDLLDDLTHARAGGAEALVAALRRRRRGKVAARLGAVVLAGAAAAGLWRVRPPDAVPVAAVAPPPTSLTPDELLDSFGDQPVALVTWPDGRQQLFAIARSGGGPGRR